MGRGLQQLPLLVLMAGATALAMLLPAAYASAHSDHHVARSFFYSALILIVLTVPFAIVLADRVPRNPARGQLLALVGAYLVLPFAMALPLTQAMPGWGWWDLWFEALSAFTTTGATIFDDPARVPDAVHLWRALIGWMGGFVMLVAAMAILSPMNLGGMEVISGRVPGRGLDGLSQTTGSIDPMQRIWRQVGLTFPAYAGATLALWLTLLMVGEDGFVAFCHALSSLSTSGISPVGGLDGASSGRWGEVLIFLTLVLSLSRRFWPGAGLRGAEGALGTDPELRLAAAIIGAVTVLLMLRHLLNTEAAGAAQALAALWGTLFTTLSFLTTTGFVAQDWQAARVWSGLETPGLLLAGLAVLGGGIATTAGGVKLLRVYALFRHAEQEMERLFLPHAVGGSGQAARRLRREGAYAAWVFFMLFALTIAGGVAALTLTGQGFDAALVLALSALTTTGSLATLAAESPLSYAALPAVTKLALGALMIVGRLETLAILVLLSPGGWRAGWRG